MDNNKKISNDYSRDMFLMGQVYGTLFSLSNKIQVKGDKYFGSMTSRQYMAMIAIAHLSKEETTINNIAKKLGTTKQSAKQVISAMEEKGFINIIPSKIDKRAVNVELTDNGKRVGLEMAEKGWLFLADLFDDFSTEELETLWKLLKRMYAFDGEEQDGFEEEGVVEFEEDISEREVKLFEEFARRRERHKK